MSDYTPLEQWLYDTGIAMPGQVKSMARRIEHSEWLAEHDRQVAERAWDRCVGEMPIDPDWKNFYSDQNPYTKGEQK